MMGAEHFARPPDRRGWPNCSEIAIPRWPRIAEFGPTFGPKCDDTGDNYGMDDGMGGQLIN